MIGLVLQSGISLDKNFFDITLFLPNVPSLVRNFLSKKGSALDLTSFGISQMLRQFFASILSLFQKIL